MSNAAVKGVVRLIVPAAKAKPSPAIGQALGPLGVNMMEFCKAFNEKTKNVVAETMTPVTLTAYEDRTFNFVTKTPHTSWFLKRCAGVDKGSQRPGTDFVGSVSYKHVYEIAKVKQTDAHLSHIPLEAICKSVVSSAKSMGIQVLRK